MGNVNLKYFKLSEFKCPCCGKAEMDEHFLLLLDQARGIAGVPFYITSGYRCEQHNLTVGGKPDSAHLRGKAADILVSSSKERFAILSGLLRAGFLRIGIHPYFIHADVDYTKPHPVVWLYPIGANK